MAAPRALLDKEGIHKVEDCITAESLFSAHKLIYERYYARLPSDTQKIMVAFHASLGVLVAEQNAEQDLGMAECAKLISAKVEEAIDKGLAKISNTVESSLTNQKDMQASSKKIEE